MLLCSLSPDWPTHTCVRSRSEKLQHYSFFVAGRPTTPLSTVSPVLGLVKAAPLLLISVILYYRGSTCHRELLVWLRLQLPPTIIVL